MQFFMLVICWHPGFSYGAPVKPDFTNIGSSLLKQQLNAMIIALDGILTNYVSIS